MAQLCIRMRSFWSGFPPVLLPVCLEQFARDNGFLEPDRTTRRVAIIGGDTAASGASYSVKIGQLWVDTTSFSLYVNSIALTVQALTVISMGNIADRATGQRAPSVHSGYSALMVRPSVAMNAYLPLLARESSEVLEVKQELDETPKFPLQLLTTSKEPCYTQASSVDPDPFATSRCRTPTVTGTGNHVIHLLTGEDSGLLCGCPRPHSDSHPGLAVTQLHVLALARDEVEWGVVDVVLDTGSDLVANCAVVMDGAWNARSEVYAAWKWLGVMLRWSEVKRLQYTFRCFLAWFIFSDTIQTITSTAILFAKTTLHMPSTSSIIIGAITPATGVVSSLPSLSPTSLSGSFISPLIVGLITDETGSIRYGLFYLIGMIWLAVPVLLSVDVERGRVNANTSHSGEQGESEAVAAE
ncbi:hypothetical protein JVU11DRAFT_6841 [Chiua virens]|nr:hypothetical protein JVU11DRAFT_6841 [Chiua virens]